MHYLEFIRLRILELLSTAVYDWCDTNLREEEGDAFHVSILAQNLGMSLRSYEKWMSLNGLEARETLIRVASDIEHLIQQATHHKEVIKDHLARRTATPNLEDSTISIETTQSLKILIFFAFIFVPPTSVYLLSEPICES